MEPISGGLKVAVYIFTVCFIYIFLVTFLPMPPAGAEHSKTIVGFLAGTVFSTLLNYYYGSSSKKQGVPEFPKMDEAVKFETEKLQAAQVEAVKKDADK